MILSDRSVRVRVWAHPQCLFGVVVLGFVHHGVQHGITTDIAVAHTHALRVRVRVRVWVGARIRGESSPGP